jgi:hypothetical protein
MMTPETLSQRRNGASGDQIHVRISPGTNVGRGTASLRLLPLLLVAWIAITLVVLPLALLMKLLIDLIRHALEGRFA